MYIKAPDNRNMTGRFGFDIYLISLVTGSVLFLPFLFSRATIDPVLLPRFYGWSILTFLLLAGMFIQSGRWGNRFDFNIANRAIFFPVSAYVVIAGFSMLNAVNFSAGFFEWLKMSLGFVYLYVACLILSRNIEGIQLLTTAATIAGLTLALIGILQYHQIAFTAIPGNYWIYATLTNKNLMASAVFLTLPFAFWEILQSSLNRRIIGYLSTGCIFYAIFLAETRSVLAAFLFSTIFIAVSASRIYRYLQLSREARQRIFKRCLTTFALICLAGLLAQMTPHPRDKGNHLLPITGSGISTSDTRPAPELPLWSLDSLSERFVLWQLSLRMAVENPLIGVGSGQWAIVRPHYGEFEKIEMDGDRFIEIQFQRPHNDYVWVLAENGVFGILAYIAIFIILAVYALKIAVKSKEADHKIFSLLMLFGLTGYMVIAFFAFPKERVVHTVFLMLIAAAIVAVYHKTFPKRRIISHRKILFCNIFFLGLLIVAGFVGYTRMQSDIHTKNGLQARQQGDWHRVISEMGQAYSPFYSVDPTATPLMWYRGMAHYELGLIEKARIDFNKAYGDHPNHVHVLNNLATCHALLNDTNSAFKYFIRMLETFPRFESGIINLCALYVVEGNYKAANDVLKRLALENAGDSAAAIVKQVRSRLEDS